MFVLLATALAWTGAVNRSGDGYWTDPTTFPEPTGPAGERYMDVSVWVDAAIGNWYYDKFVAVYWTVSGSGVWTKADAWYEYDLGDGYEQWGTDFDPFGTLEHTGAWTTFTDYLGFEHDIYGTDLVFEYVVMVEMGGATYWDNNGGANYTLTLHESEIDDQGDGTLLDTASGLTWSSCPINARTGAAVTTADCSGATPSPWAWGRTDCSALSLGGRDDWRLPTESEIAGWAVLSGQVPTLFEDYSPNSLDVDRFFWSSTDSAASRRYAMGAVIGPSSTGAATSAAKTANHWTWCVAG